MFDFQAFYDTATGHAVQSIITPYINEYLQDNKLAILKQGFTDPYSAPLDNEKPEALAENAFDLIIAIHHLEFAENISESLKQSYTVLKSQGRMLLVVPNRGGLWARANWTPFGNGIPFNLRQMRFYLTETQFEIVKIRKALYIPPFTNPHILKVVPQIERLASFLCPFTAGVHIIEVRKNLYAPTGTAVKSGLFSRKSLIAKPSS
jgi:SAM-dependent methyltransferase